jgi:hypothetical protein
MTGRFINPKWAGRARRLWRHDALKADGTLMGKRLAALVGLRDRARRVLQSQNEGWPEANRNEARRELNRAYDRLTLPTARSTRRRSGKPPTAASSAACPTS